MKQLVLVSGWLAVVCFASRPGLRARKTHHSRGDLLVETQANASSLYSQQGQDEWVLSVQDSLREAGQPRNFVFMEIGARDADEHSNTRRLEENGWTGTCIDPFPTNFESIPRKCTLVKAALVAEKTGKRMFANCQTGPSGLSGFIKDNKNKDAVSGCPLVEVPQVTFAELNVPKALDYVSLDVEGLEQEVLKAFPKEVCVRLWTVEGAGEVEKHEEGPIGSLLGARGCTRVKMSYSDGFYRCDCK